MADPSTPGADEDLRILADSIARLLEQAGGITRARRLRGSETGWDGAVLREMAEAGVLGVLASENVGGLGMGLPAAGVVAREIGRTLAPEPVIPLVALSAGMLERLCTAHPLLARLLAGAAVPALAHAERAPQGAASVECNTRLADGRLTGAKAWVAGAAGADSFLVTARGENGPVLALGRRDAAGLDITRQPQADGSVALELCFDATPAEVLAEGPAVEEVLSRCLDDARALAAAELVGIAARAFESTLDYLSTREQFGQPIGRFQALQHRAVDMKMALDVADAAVFQALDRMERSSDPATRAREASRAKARASEAARLITREAIQMHGAIGYTDEHDIGLYLNRALVLSAWLGDAARHRRRWLDLRETARASA